MYPIFEGERARNKVTLQMIADDPRVDYTVSTISLKLNGKAPLTFNDAIIFKDVVGSNLSLEELYKED